MREVFQQSLREVQDRLVEIAELVEKSIQGATTAFNEADVPRAEAVIEDSDRVDELVIELDALITEILARQQPVASDLRLMVGSLRMSTNLERMSDLAQHIAQLSRYRYPDSAVPEELRKVFRKMGETCRQMAALVVELLQTQEEAVIPKIRDLDDDLDERHAKVFEKVLADKLGDNTVSVVDATLASRYHERFGDHAVSIAKQMDYFLSGSLEATS